MWEHTEHKSSVFKPFSEAYPGPLKTSKMRSFSIIYITYIIIYIIAKLSILDVCRVPSYTSAQLTFPCSKSTIETREKSVKYVPS